MVEGPISSHQRVPTSFRNNAGSCFEETFSSIYIVVAPNDEKSKDLTAIINNVEFDLPNLAS